MTDLFDITHGAGGLFEVHKWNNSLELNTELTAAGDDRYFIETISPGFGGLAEIPDPTTPKVGRPGVNFRPTERGAITRIYKGEIQSDSVPGFRALRTTLAGAFADTTTYGTMDLIPQYEPVYPAVDNSPTARYYAIPLYLDPPEEITSQRFKRDFTLALLQIDPRVYFLGLAVDQTSIYPLSVTNPGNAPADPILHVAGASGTVTVSDGTHTLTFLNCPSGTLDIDFGQRTAKVGATPVQLDVANSDWWDSHVPGIAGDTTVTVTQTGGTSIRVTFIPASWG